MSNEDIKMSDELKPCPFCNGNASMTQTGENFVIVRCLTLYCQPHPSAVCYKKSDGEYDFYPWNNRHDTPMALRIKELELALTKIKDITGELGGQNPANFCEELAMEQDDATYRVYKLSNGALSKALEQSK